MVDTTYIFNTVREIVADALGTEISLVDLATSAESDQNWDSLVQIDILAGLENRFNIVVSDDELIELISVESIVSLVQYKIND